MRNLTEVPLYIISAAEDGRPEAINKQRHTELGKNLANLGAKMTTALIKLPGARDEQPAYILHDSRHNVNTNVLLEYGLLYGQQCVVMVSGAREADALDTTTGERDYLGRFVGTTKGLAKLGAFYVRTDDVYYSVTKFGARHA